VDGNALNEADDNSARQLVILGLLLQTLHVLFGFTAIMGMFINHMLVDQSENTVYHSHIRWQLITFWLCAALYALAFLVWHYTGSLWPALSVLLFTFYRIAISAYYCSQSEPIKRII